MAALAEKDARLSLRTAPPHDGSGFGKPRTLHDAITADTAYAVVCCMDADVHLSEGTLGGAIKLLDVRSDVAAVSVMPRLDVESAAEGLLVPAFVAAAGSTAPPSRVHDTDRQDAFLNGQFIVVRRAALDDVGGFAAVSDTVLEDVALARLLKHNGHGLLLCDARDLVATRMYDSFASIVAGFGKNARPLHGSSLLRTGVMLVVVSWLPWLAVIAAALTADSADDAVAAAGIVIALLSQMMNRRTLGSSMWWAFCGPLAMTVVGAVYVKAALSPTQTWRGRRFAVR